jgi:periplasmic divalent cation tolerance protein
MTDALVVLVSAPDAETAARLGRAVVEERLAACVSVVSGVRSIYRWQGAIRDEAEALLVIKSTAARFAALRERVLALHPYETPEVLALAVADGAEEYLSWLGAETAG